MIANKLIKTIVFGGILILSFGCKKPKPICECEKNFNFSYSNTFYGDEILNTWLYVIKIDGDKEMGISVFTYPENLNLSKNEKSFDITPDTSIIKTEIKKLILDGIGPPFQYEERWLGKSGKIKIKMVGDIIDSIPYEINETEILPDVVYLQNRY